MIVAENLPLYVVQFPSLEVLSRPLHHVLYMWVAESLCFESVLISSHGG
jgi:hypothetical protein